MSSLKEGERREKMAMAEVGMESQPSPPLHGDVLEAIVSKVATVDLLSASDVSRTWRRAVASSLRGCPRRKPWLVLRLRTASVAYDPHSRAWAPLPLSPPFPPRKQLCRQPIRSSHSQLYFALSAPSNLSIAEPVSATWTHLPLPRAARCDPVVALVGSRAVVAGGTWGFEDAAPGAVESFDLLGRRRWEPCEPIPDGLGSSATCLSVATSDDTMYAIDKSSGMFSSFDPETGKWARTCDLRPDRHVRLSAIGFSGGRLLLAGLSDLSSLTLWEVDPNDPGCNKEIGRMPKEMAERLVGEGAGSMATIGFSTAGDYAYLYNPGHFQEAFFYDFGERRWESVSKPKEVDHDPTAKIIFGCSTVGLDHLIKLFPR